MPSVEPVSHDHLVVCACEGQEYKARDAIEAVMFRGELDPEWKEFLRSTEAETRADELDIELDESAIDTAAEAFRYKHDLITAEETEQWLGARGLTLDDFSNYFSRQYWGTALSERIEPQEIDYFSAPGGLRNAFTAQLILSGKLDLMTTQFSWRLAARSAAKEPDPEVIAEEERIFFERNQFGPAQLPNWLERLGRDSDWFSEMLALEAAYRQRCETLLVPQARQRELATLRLPLTRFEMEVIELESRDAAQEALLCVREDGMSMEEVATEGRYPYHRVACLLEDLSDDLQPRFLSVVNGEVLEPMVRGEGFQLYRVTRKIEPQPDDPAIQTRIEQRLLERHFSELAGKYVDRRLGTFTQPE